MFYFKNWLKSIGASIGINWGIVFFVIYFHFLPQMEGEDSSEARNFRYKRMFIFQEDQMRTFL